MSPNDNDSVWNYTSPYEDEINNNEFSNNSNTSIYDDVTTKNNAEEVYDTDSNDGDSINQAVESKIKYVGNKNSLILHYEDCEFAEKMAAYNKVIFETKEEAISLGYRPCFVCEP